MSTSFSAFSRRVFLIVATVLLLAALWFFRNTLLLAFLGVVVAVGISIPASWLVKRRWPRTLANIVSVLAVGVVTLVLLLWLVPTITAELGNLLTSLPQGLRNLAQEYNGLLERNAALARVLSPVEVSPGNVSEAEARRIFEGVVNTGLPILVSGGSLAINFLTNFVLVMFMTLLFLADPTAYVKASLYLVPKSYQPRMVELWGELYQTLKTWLSSLFISITITVTLVFVILGLLGMPNVLVVAVFSGFATFVPNIGAFLPLVPITVFTLAHDPAKLLVMAPVYLAIQLVESNVLTPFIVKQQLSIPAAGMLVFQLVAALIFGVLGALLAVPLLAVIITLMRELYSYDVLGLRGESLEVALNRDNQLLVERGVSAEPPGPEKVVEPELPSEPE